MLCLLVLRRSIKGAIAISETTRANCITVTLVLGIPMDCSKFNPPEKRNIKTESDIIIKSDIAIAGMLFLILPRGYNDEIMRVAANMRRGIKIRTLSSPFSAAISGKRVIKIISAY